MQLTVTDLPDGKKINRDQKLPKSLVDERQREFKQISNIIEILKNHSIKSNPVWKECTNLRNVSSIVTGTQEYSDVGKFENDCHQLEQAYFFGNFMEAN